MEDTASCVVNLIRDGQYYHVLM